MFPNNPINASAKEEPHKVPFSNYVKSIIFLRSLDRNRMAIWYALACILLLSTAGAEMCYTYKPNILITNNRVVIPKLWLG